jgi:hypothetical protein
LSFSIALLASSLQDQTTANDGKVPADVRSWLGSPLTDCNGMISNQQHLYTKLTNAKPRDSPVSRSYAMYIREMGPKALKSSCKHMASGRQHMIALVLPIKVPQVYKNSQLICRLAIFTAMGLTQDVLGLRTRRSSSRVSSDKLVTRTLFSSRLCMESPIVAPPPAARALHTRGAASVAQAASGGPGTTPHAKVVPTRTMQMDTANPVCFP